MLTTIAATVGTSLKGNLKELAAAGADHRGWLARQPEREHAWLEARLGTVLEAARAVAAGAWETAGLALAELPEVGRVHGAEIASLTSLLEQRGERYRGIRSVHLLHSDSADGKGCAEAVAAYLAATRGLSSTPVAIADLDHRNANRFRLAGLRNLAAALATLAEQDPHGLVIDATGGYKGQIAIATLFGQAFGVPVTYRYEGFDHTVEIPQMPLTLDLGVVAEHFDLLAEDTLDEASLHERFGPELSEANRGFARFRCCLGESETVDRVRYWEVSPLGRILRDRFLVDHRGEAPPLPPAISQERPRWGEHHLPRGVEELVERLLARAPWITRVEARDAAGRSGGSGVSFRLPPSAVELPPIECCFTSADHPALLALKTTARSVAEQQAALAWLAGQRWS